MKVTLDMEEKELLLITSALDFYRFDVLDRRDGAKAEGSHTEADRYDNLAERIRLEGEKLTREFEIAAKEEVQ